MSQQIRAAQLLREAANLLQSPDTTVASTVPPSTGTTTTSSTPAVQAIRSLFGPYNRRGYGRRGRASWTARKKTTGVILDT